MDLSRFTAQQRDVIVAEDGPLSILAGPGSRKTTTLAGRIAYLVSERDVPPTSILAITFTTAAAATLRSRLETVLGSAATRVDIRTFHSFGLRVIRTWSEELGFGHLPPAVYGREETRILLRKAATSIGLAVAPDRPTGDSDPWLLSVARLEHWLERFRLCGSTAEEPDALHQEVLRDLAAVYEQQLVSQGAVDYAAMLLMPLRLFELDPRTAVMMGDAYRTVLVDEFQDVCRIQYKLLQPLVRQHNNLAVVGDPQQCLPPGTLVQTPTGSTPIEELSAGDFIVAGAGRGSVVSARLEEVLKRPFEGDLLRVVLRSGRSLRLTPSHMCFAKLAAYPGIYQVYLMYRDGMGYRIGMTLGARPSPSNPAILVNGLIGRTAMEAADKAWLLKVCHNRE